MLFRVGKIFFRGRAHFFCEQTIKRRHAGETAVKDHGDEILVGKLRLQLEKFSQPKSADIIVEIVIEKFSEQAGEVRGGIPEFVRKSVQA